MRAPPAAVLPAAFRKYTVRKDELRGNRVKRKWLEKAIPLIQLAAAVILTAAALYLLYRYAQYGEKQKETSARTSGEQGQTEGQELPAAAGEPLPDTVFVRIMGQDFLSDVHGQVTVSGKKGFVVEEVEEWNKDDGGAEADSQLKEIYAPGEVLTVEAPDMEPGEILLLKGNDGAELRVESIERADGIPQYKGRLYLIGEEEGIGLINEIDLEEYLYSVVSSEMPSDYPEEALKAQAVCARTYTVNCIRNGRGKTAYEDLDDSVSFQVYNNHRSTKRSRKAVKETAGEILPLDEIQYYSTSCLSENHTDLSSEEKFREFLAEQPPEGAEYNSPWLRWTVEIPVSTITDMIRTEYGEGVFAGEETEYGEDVFTDKETDSGGSVSAGGDALRISDIVRRGDGQIQSLTLSVGGRSYEIEGEYNVRKMLGSPQAEILLLDGGKTSGMQLLPSAFFYLDGEEQSEYEYASGETVWFYGGGYGHGNGMSQYGAAGMASNGLDYRAILEYYYKVSVITNP